MYLQTLDASSLMSMRQTPLFLHFRVYHITPGTENDKLELTRENRVYFQYLLFSRIFIESARIEPFKKRGS